MPFIENSITYRPIRVRETEILATDTQQQYREKIAKITLDSMVQFVGLLDAEGTVLEINHVALNAVEIKLSEVEGKPFWTTFWWQVSEEINAGLREMIARAAKGEFVRWDTPIYGRAGGKETIIIDASLCPVVDDNGKVVFICAEGRDITEKKAQEREIAQKNIELQGLLGRIRELDEIKTQFFANVSHELRTPLALIIGPAERLLKPDSISPEAQRETAQTIVSNAKMLLKHVNDLLDISKLEANKLKIDLQETDIAELIRFVASHFELLANERRVDFRIETGSSYPALVDAEKLQRIVMNLLSNAFKFAPVSGTIRCKLETGEKEWILSVEDSGPGVKPELRKVIFERFRQGDGASNRQFAGTGLGLAIAHEFVEMHKGNIEVLESDLGGALFRVKFPATPILIPGEKKIPSEQKIDRSTLDGLIEELRIPVISESTNENERPSTINKEIVLVVEDNPEMNKFIAQSLADDYQVITAFDGQEGLQKALIFYPALIVTDIMMPRVSGVEMIAELRKRPEMQETPILLLSAKADEDLKLKLLEESAQDFITKPFSERDLQIRIRNLITLKRTHEAKRGAERAKRQAVEAVNRELRSRSNKLSELFEQTPSFMAVLRAPNHVFELANTAYLKLIGHREIIGKSLLKALPEIRGQGFVEILDRVVATGEPFTGTAVPVLLQREPSAEMEERYLDFVYQPLFDADGVVGVFVEGHDVTNQKRAEDALRMADRRKDEFLATLAHELRNPLAPIRHAASISQAPDATEAELKRSQEVIVRQVENMGRLLDDLMDISRITRGKLELRKERLSFNDSLKTVVETARPMIEARGHKLELEIQPINHYIHADPVRFEQIFSNLLTNAAKYTDRGGVILVKTKFEKGFVTATIIDNGIGIASDQLSRIFEMFSQATTAIDRSEGGLGIGLALVRGLVLLHGGTIEGRSAGMGKGSEFVVSLPLVQSELENSGTKSPASSESIASNPKHKRVLIVDDNRDNADLCAILLKKSGHQVRTSYTGNEALTIAAEFKPDFILLDIGMSEMNGYEVARQIRATKWGKEIVLVAVTGWGQEEDKRQARSAGFNHHITKPFNANVLKELLAQ